MVSLAYLPFWLFGSHAKVAAVLSVIGVASSSAIVINALDDKTKTTDIAATKISDVSSKFLNFTKQNVVPIFKQNPIIFDADFSGSIIGLSKSLKKLPSTVKKLTTGIINNLTDDAIKNHIEKLDKSIDSIVDIAEVSTDFVVEKIPNYIDSTIDWFDKNWSTKAVVETTGSLVSSLTKQPKMTKEIAQAAIDDSSSFYKFFKSVTLNKFQMLFACSKSAAKDARCTADENKEMPKVEPDIVLENVPISTVDGVALIDDNDIVIPVENAVITNNPPATFDADLPSVEETAIPESPTLPVVDEVIKPEEPIKEAQVYVASASETPVITTEIRQASIEPEIKVVITPVQPNIPKPPQTETPKKPVIPTPSTDVTSSVVVAPSEKPVEKQEAKPTETPAPKKTSTPDSIPGTITIVPQGTGVPTVEIKEEKSTTSVSSTQQLSPAGITVGEDVITSEEDVGTGTVTRTITNKSDSHVIKFKKTQKTDTSSLFKQLLNMFQTWQNKQKKNDDYYDLKDNLRAVKKQVDEILKKTTSFVVKTHANVLSLITVAAGGTLTEEEQTLVGQFFGNMVQFGNPIGKSESVKSSKYNTEFALCDGKFAKSEVTAFGFYGASCEQFDKMFTEESRQIKSIIQNLYTKINENFKKKLDQSVREMGGFGQNEKNTRLDERFYANYALKLFETVLKNT